MNPRMLLLAAGVLALQGPGVRPLPPLPEPTPAPRGSETLYPGRQRSPEESRRRIEAAVAKRERRRQRRLKLARDARASGGAK